MKKELVIPLGITFIAGILIMLAGCGSSNVFNPLPNIQITNIVDGVGNASGTATASFTINVFGPDIIVNSETETQQQISPTTTAPITASATPTNIGFFHTQPNNGTTAATYAVTATYSGGTAGTTILITRVYSYSTVPGNAYGTFPVSFKLVF